MKIELLRAGPQIADLAEVVAKVNELVARINETEAARDAAGRVKK